MSYGGSSGSGRIATAADAALSNPADSQVLVYSASTQKWTNSAVPGMSDKLDATAAQTMYASINSPSFTGTPTVNGAALTGGAASAIVAGSTTTLTGLTNSAVNIVTLGRNTTFSIPNASAGSQFLLALVQDATGSRTVTWPGNVVFSGNTVPTLTTTPNRTDILRFINISGTAWIAYVDALNVPVTVGASGGTSTGSQFTVTAAPADGQVVISWTTTSTITGLTGWYVGRDGTDAGGGGPWSTTDSASTTSHTFLNLTDGTPYTFSVAAVVNGTVGTAVTIQSTPQAAAATPTVAATVADGAGQSTLSWTVSGGSFTGLTGWYVGRDGTDSNGSGPWSTTVSATTSSQTFFALTGGTTYTLSVAPIINGTVGTAVTAAAHPTTVSGGSSTATRYTSDQPFASNSIWNTAIGSGATFESSGGTKTAKLLSGGTYINSNNGYSISVNIASTSDPTATVSVSSPSNTFSHRMPTGATISAGSDGNLDVVVGQYLYEYWQVTKNSNTSYSANSGYKVDLLGSGINTGIRAASFSTLGGLIRATELTNLSITHAIVMAIPTSYAKHGYVWPAASEDWNGSTAYSGTIPLGSLFSIPGTVNLNSLGLTNQGLALARALQDYGVYVGDTSSQVTLYAEPSVQANNGSGYNNMLSDWQNILRGQLRAVTNSTSSSVGGGGTPRQAAQATPTVPPGSPS